MSASGRRPFPEPPGMVSGVEPETHGMGKCEQFTELAIYGEIEIVEDYLDPVFRVSLNKGFPILV
jgi:hypothetical protein